MTLLSLGGYDSSSSSLSDWVTVSCLFTSLFSLHWRATRSLSISVWRNQAGSIFILNASWKEAPPFFLPYHRPLSLCPPTTCRVSPGHCHPFALASPMTPRQSNPGWLPAGFWIKIDVCLVTGTKAGANPQVPHGLLGNTCSSGALGPPYHPAAVGSLECHGPKRPLGGNCWCWSMTYGQREGQAKGKPNAGVLAGECRWPEPKCSPGHCGHTQHSIPGHGQRPGPQWSAEPVLRA